MKIIASAFLLVGLLFQPTAFADFQRGMGDGKSMGGMM